MKEIIIKHKKMSEKEALKTIKELYELYPEIIMKPSIWLKKRKIIKEIG